MSDVDFIYILTNLRTVYEPLLKQKRSQNYSRLSKTGTLAGTIEEVRILLY